jgi:hypothetical protein
MKKIKISVIAILIFLLTFILIPSTLFAQNQISNNNGHKYNKEYKFEKNYEIKIKKEFNNFKNYIFEKILGKNLHKKNNINNNKNNINNNDVIIRLLENEIKWFNNLKNRVQNMPNISSDLKTQLISDIDKYIQTLQNKENDIKNSTSQISKKVFVKDFKELLKLKEEIVRKIVNAIHATNGAKSINNNTTSTTENSNVSTNNSVTEGTSI